jgi:hypothetical protein
MLRLIENCSGQFCAGKRMSPGKSLFHALHPRAVTCWIVSASMGRKFSPASGGNVTGFSYVEFSVGGK